MTHPKISEAQLQSAVIELAQTLGWKIAHFRPARTKFGWRTAVSGDGKGFPDCIILRGDRGIAAELKSAKGNPTEAQLAWLDAFIDAGFKAYIWRPADWFGGGIEDALR